MSSTMLLVIIWFSSTLAAVWVAYRASMKYRMLISWPVCSVCRLGAGSDCVHFRARMDRDEIEYDMKLRGHRVT